MNALKILYILLAGIGVFFIPNSYILLAVIFVHLVLYFFLPNKEKSLKFLWKIRWFVLILLFFHSLSFHGDFTLLKLKKWSLDIDYDGFLTGVFMSLKLLSMLTVTQVVRYSMTSEQFVQGLSALGLSRDNAKAIDQIMDIIALNPGGKGNGSGKGQGKGKGKGGGRESTTDNTEEDQVRSRDVLFKGKIGSIPNRLMERINFARDKFGNDPNAIVASSALSITLIRMVKIAPGLPLAPGHKNLLLMPVFIQGIVRSEKPFTGTRVGFISGILHFSLGFGKYGPLGIFQFALVGFVLDLFLRLPVRKTRLWFLMTAGALGGLLRISSEILLAWVLGLPEAFFLIYLPYVISQVAFGAASGLITLPLLKKIPNE